MDFVFSSHLLEHLEKPLDALKEWWRVIKQGGYLVLYLPHKDFYPNIGEEGSAMEHLHDFGPSHIVTFMKEVGGWDLVENESRNEGNEYSFFQVYRKRSDKQQLHLWSRERAKKTCCVVRYGGWGDMIQTSSVLPLLRNAGYHITVNTNPRGYDVLRHDPNIDEFFVQDTDQVPNEELVPYWTSLSKKFDKFINFSESVEGTFLALPGRTFYYWNHQARHSLLNRNYLEFMHELAGVPYIPRPKFYPSSKEIEKAGKRIRKIGGKVIMWVLDGSSVHKHWPLMDNAFARILTSSDYKIVTVGNELSKMLESGWENEPRIIKKAGEWSIRDTLTFAMMCDMVIGPETGVMNAVSFEPIPKIVFLSHSSVENLSRDWLNCISLEPENCQCYPCHKMIYEWKDCKRAAFTYYFNDRALEIEGSMCQTNITLDKFWSAFIRHSREFS